MGFVGRAMKNISRAWAVCLGCALTLAVGLGAGSFVLFAEAKTLWGDYLAGMLAGVSYGLGAMLPASILMLRWFSSHRGTAIGICAAGTGISAVVVFPILSARIERLSLRVCFYFEALATLLWQRWCFFSSAKARNRAALPFPSCPARSPISRGATRPPISSLPFSLYLRF